MTGEPRAPASGTRFHRKVAGLLAALTGAVMALLVVAIHLIGRAMVDRGMELRADAMARAGAAALATPGVDLDEVCRRIRENTPSVVGVAVRDARGAVLAGAGPADPSAGVFVARSRIPRGEGPAAGGVLEIAAGGAVLAGLLDRTTLLAAAVGLLLAAAAALVGGLLARRLVQPVGRLAEVAGRMAAGDLSAEVGPGGPDEMGTLAAGIGTLTAGLRRMLAGLRDGAGEVKGGAAAIGESARQTVQAIGGLAKALEETASRMAEIAQASRLATESAHLVIEVAERSERQWREGEQTVRDGVAGLQLLEQRVGAIARSVTELSEQTVQIAGIIATVKDLAEQSNVLALNAAIEAARVGEAGQGFAVVADEMRRLAEQSRRATDEVRGRLVELHRATSKVVAVTGEGAERTRAAVAGARQADQTIGGLAGAVTESSRAARGIAETTRRQTEELEGMVTAVEYLHATMAEVLDETRRNDDAAGRLREAAGRLTDLLAAYRT